MQKSMINCPQHRFIMTRYKPKNTINSFLDCTTHPHYSRASKQRQYGSFSRASSCDGWRKAAKPGPFTTPCDSVERQQFIQSYQHTLHSDPLKQGRFTVDSLLIRIPLLNRCQKLFEMGIVETSNYRKFVDSFGVVLHVLLLYPYIIFLWNLILKTNLLNRQNFWYILIQMWI